MHNIMVGQWVPYLDLDEMFSWYMLPDDTLAEALAYRPDGSELTPIPDGAYAQLHAETVAYVRASVAPYGPAYHNDEMHFAATEADGLQATDAYAEHNKLRAPRLVRQMFGLSLRTHDAFHCASTFRAQAPRGVHWPELGTNVSSEWVTSIANDQFLRQRGVNVPARLFQIYVAWSSTYGGATPYGQQLRIPNPRPTTFWGATMRAADVCPPKDWRTWLQRTIGVNYGEVPASPPAQSWGEWVGKEQAFADYINACFNRVDHVAGFELTARIGWRRRLSSQWEWVTALTNRRSDVSQYAVRLLTHYGAELH